MFFNVEHNHSTEEMNDEDDSSRSWASVLSLSLWASAGGMATPGEAKALSEKAAALVNEKGEAAFATFSVPDGVFITKDLYVFCMDLEDKLHHPKR